MLKTINKDVQKLINSRCWETEQREDRTIYRGSARSTYGDIQINIEGFKCVYDWSDGYRNVYVSENDLTMITTCEGDLIISISDNLENYQSEIKRAEEFYSEY